ncbi:MAG: hypothetical protein HDS60_03760 [Barnesiella sp.]|nr:hypothetical protein [Barnesiella sp.]
MKPHELRLAQEHARAARHLRNLNSFVEDKSRFPFLDTQQRNLILEQIDALERYVKVLEKRLKLLNIPI